MVTLYYDRQKDVQLDGPLCSIRRDAATNTDSLGTAVVSPAGSQKPAVADHSVAAQYQDCTVSHCAD